MDVDLLRTRLAEALEPHDEVEVALLFGSRARGDDLSNDPPIALLLAVLRDGLKIRERRPGAYGRFVAHSLMVLETDLPGYRAMQRAFVQRVAERGLVGGS